jgi:hypothetical protein
VSSLVTNEGARKNINNLAVSQVTAALVIFLMRTSPNPCNYVILAGLAVLIQTYKNSCKVIDRKILSCFARMIANHVCWQQCVNLPTVNLAGSLQATSKIA